MLHAQVLRSGRAGSRAGLIELKQRSSQLPNLAVDFGATDFPAVARALGGEGGAGAGPLHDHRREDRPPGL